MINAAVISIGDELLIGQTINTNASWLGEKLNINGIKNSLVITTSDEAHAITSSLDYALKNSDIVLLTGGLGPTKDDITKKTLCTYFGGELHRNETIYSLIKDYFEKRDRPFLESNMELAMMPNNCEVIINKKGTAAGMLWKKNNKIIVSMPGVPYEMKNMMEENIFPLLKKKFTTETIVHKTLMVAGLGESIIAEKIKSVEDNLPNYIKLAYLPNLGILRLRLTGQGNDPKLLNERIDLEAEKIKSLLPGYYYGDDEIRIAQTIQDFFITHDLKLGLAESCSGGDISAEIVKIAGSSQYYKGSIVAYDYDIKEQILEVDAALIQDKGAVSEDVVLAMAKNARKKLNADYAIGVSGIAGPSGGLPEKPVGTVWMGFSSKNKSFAKKLIFPLDREKNIRLTTNYALFNLLRFVKEEV